MEVHDIVSYRDLLAVESGEIDYEDVIEGAFYTLTNINKCYEFERSMR